MDIYTVLIGIGALINLPFVILDRRYFWHNGMAFGFCCAVFIIRIINQS